MKIKMIMKKNHFYKKKNRIWSNGLAVKALDSQSRGSAFKTLGGSKVVSAFHPLEVEKMSSRNFWGLSGEKQTVSS